MPTPAKTTAPKRAADARPETNVDELTTTHNVEAVSGLTTEQVAALAFLREPTRDSEVGYKPQVWCSACSNARKESRGARIACEHHSVVNPCPRCGNKLTTAHVDLRYMGHAAVTRRLLLGDPSWSWDSVSRNLSDELVRLIEKAIESGMPELAQMLVDSAPPRAADGGLWIRLTYAGITKLGFGDAQGKTGPNAVKETIGDAIRNAAMRFGCGLDLWHKGEFEDEKELSNRRSESADPEPEQARQEQDTTAEAPQAAPAPQPAAEPAQTAAEPSAQPTEGDPTAGREMTADSLCTRILSTTRIAELERLRAYVAQMPDAVVHNRDGVQERMRDVFKQQADWIRAQP